MYLHTLCGCCICTVPAHVCAGVVPALIYFVYMLNLHMYVLYPYKCVNVVPVHVCIDVVHACMCMYVCYTCVCMLNLSICIERGREFRFSCLSLDVKECRASGTSCSCRNRPLGFLLELQELRLFILTTDHCTSMLLHLSPRAPSLGWWVFGFFLC